MTTTRLLPASTTTALDRLLEHAVASSTVPPTALLAIDVSSPTPLYRSPLSSSPASGGTIDGSTVLQIFSMTKLVTSIAALQLVDRGLVALDSDVGRWLPGLRDPVILKGFDDEGKPVLVPAKNRVTLGMLLNHTSGLALEMFRPELAQYRKVMKHGFGAKDPAYYHQPLCFEPGTHFSYSPSTDYVGLLVETLTGLSLEFYFQANIFRPLGMHSTTFLPSPSLLHRMTLPLHFRSYETNNLITPIPPTNPLSYFALPPSPSSSSPTPVPLLGASGLFGSMDDYALLLRHLLQLSPSSPIKLTAKASLISQKSWKSLFAPTLAAQGATTDELGMMRPEWMELEGGSSGEWSTCLHVNTRDWEGRRRAFSGAWSGMANTHFFIDPMTGIALIAGTQLFPADDLAIKDLYIEFERLVYAGLEENKRRSRFGYNAKL